MLNLGEGRALYIGLLLVGCAHGQNTTVPRWGQAVALVESTLFVQGGRTDQYNAYSYTSAPVTNDIFTLSLSASFGLSSPPWNYRGGCSNCSVSQGPAVAWHTLTPFDTTNLLLFGGDSGPNSPIAVQTNPDSAVLLSIASSDVPVWDFVSDSWANEPIRRIYHTASSTGGKVYVVGGQKDDGSGEAFSDNYVFDPSGPSFSTLPSTNGPPDITGHQAVVISDGRLLVFGGYSPSQKALIPFTTVWSLDTTQSSPTWTSMSVSSAPVPSPRRGFAAALTDGGKVVIQGGADAVMQTSFDDGWALDTSQDPMVWSSVSSLTELGPRRDHFALGVGSSVLFGFGYAQNGGASAALQLFDTSTNSFVTSYTPPSAITQPTASTLPASSQTNAASNPQSSGTGTGTPVYGSGEIPYPTGSQSAGSGGDNGSNPNNPGGGNDGGNGNTLPSATTRNHTLIIALSTVLGVLALLVGSIVAVWYVRHRRDSGESFHHLLDEGSDDGELAAALPIASTHEKNLPATPGLRTIRGHLSSFLPYGKTQYPERIDMLADEDTSQYNADWQMVRRDPSSGRSSWTSHQSRRRPTLERVYNSLASIRSAGGAVLDYAAGAAAASTRSFRSREASTGSRSATWRTEKHSNSFDPYSDDFALLRYDAPNLNSSNASRPRGGRQGSSYSYRNPFEDYEVESLDYDPDTVYHDEPDGPSLDDLPPLPKLQTHVQARRASLDLTRLTPVSEKPSVATVTDSFASDSSLSRGLASTSNVASGPSSSQLSHEPPQSPRRPSSIIDANPQPPTSQFMRRSNSWWTRFTKAPLLDRRSSDRSPKSIDFRDPNPPPRLGPIEEGSHTNSPDSPANKHRNGSGGHGKVYSSSRHGRSSTSLQTARTANSDILERMGQTMQIVQKDSTLSSHASGPSTVSHGGSPEGSYSSSTRPLSVIADSRSQLDDPPEGVFVQSPSGMTVDEQSQSLTGITADLPLPKRPLSGSDRASSAGSVAEKIQAYERRMSQSSDSPIKLPPSISNRSRRGASIYGLAPKPALFVANPDDKRGSDSL